MRKGKRTKERQINAILRETNNPAIVEDVLTDTEFGTLNELKVPRNPTYGKG